MLAWVANVALSDDLYTNTNGLLYFYDRANCISFEPQYYRTVRCTIINRLLVYPFELRPAILPQNKVGSSRKNGKLPDYRYKQ